MRKIELKKLVFSDIFIIVRQEIFYDIHRRKDPNIFANVPD